MAPLRFVDTASLYCGDNLELLSQFPSESVDLIYLDPPFFTDRYYEVIWGDEAEIRSFEDRWEGGIQVYVNWMQERMVELHRVLRPTGSLYLHCDWHAGHYLKVMMDDVFGYNRFQNEYVWYYSGGGASKKRWARKHDTVLFYTKGSSWTFNADAVRTPYKWTQGQKRADQSARDLEKGKLADDVWEHHGVMPWAHERLGYPTQKPEALLERIIRASSNPGDVVMDPFCGCGTTIAVAQQLGREWIGMDISPTAAALMKRRVERAGATNVKIHGLPMSEAELRLLKPYEFQNWVVQQVSGTHSPRKSGDMGIDGLSFMYHEPIQVKQSESVGRNTVDNFETAVERSGKDIGYIVAFSFTKGAYEEAARAKAAGKATIVLVKVSDLLEAADGLTRPSMPQAPARRPTPELMRLLSASQRAISDQPLPPPRPKDARPSIQQLVESDQAPVG